MPYNQIFPLSVLSCSGIVKRVCASLAFDKLFTFLESVDMMGPGSESQGGAIVAVGLTFGFLTSLVVALRLISRGFLARSIGADDCEYLNI